MYTSTVFVLSFALRALPVLSLAHPGPKPTDTTSNIPNSIGWTPKPTNAPFANSPPELHRRQSYAPINTCGWVDGNAADPYYCANGYACSANSVGSYFGCCQTDVAGNFLADDCAYIATPYTGCYDFTLAAYCTGVCYNQNRVCDQSLPYCAMATMNSGAEILTNYGCSSEIYVRALDIETAIKYTSSFGSGTAAATTSSVSVNGNIVSTGLTPPTTDSPASSTTIASSNTSGSGPSTSTYTGTPKPAHSHAAAIAGGVVGGLAGLAMILGGVIFWLHKRKQREKKFIAPEISQTI